MPGCRDGPIKGCGEGRDDLSQKRRLCGSLPSRVLTEGGTGRLVPGMVCEAARGLAGQPACVVRSRGRTRTQTLVAASHRRSLGAGHWLGQDIGWGSPRGKRTGSCRESGGGSCPASAPGLSAKGLGGKDGAGARGRRIREEGGLRARTVLAPPCCQRRRAERIWRDEQGCWGRDPGSSSGTGCLWLPVIPASSRHPEPGTRHHGAPTLPHRPRPRQRQRRQGGRCPLQRGPHFRTQRSGRAGLCRCGEGGGPSLPFSGSLRCASVPFSSNLLDSFIQAMGRSLVPDVGTR